MAATTISRTALAASVDDDGTGTTGTILTKGYFGATFFDPVDALFATSVQFETTGLIAIGVRATAAGIATFAALKVGSDVAADHTGLYSFSSTFTPAGANKSAGTLLEAKGVGGLTLAADHASGVIDFRTGSSATLWGRLDNNGHWIYSEATSDPSASDLTSGANVEDRMAIYMKNDKLVIAYNRTGTVNYLTIALNGAATTFSVGTGAP